MVHDSSVLPTISDINECTRNTDGCDHTCSNTMGSYNCRCWIGYRLATNGRTCQGNYFLVSCKVNIHSAVFQILMNVPLILMDVTTFALILSDPICVDVQLGMHLPAIGVHVKVMSSYARI